MALLEGFPPLVATGARALVLGSMPSAASLAQHQYYAHPRNQFWLIMSTLLGADFNQPYTQRCCALLDHRIALWDVIARCHRVGSLDAAIAEETVVTNDVCALLKHYKTIRSVFFNGAKAKAIYDKYILPTLPPTLEIDYRQLPSTSPAHAVLSLQDKIQVWQQVKKCVMG